MTRQKGFTLIELLTTLGVATILLSIAVPNVQEFKRNARQTNGINQLISGMRVARNTAITTNSRVTVCTSSNGTGCEAVTWESGWIAFVDLDSDRTVDLNESIVRVGAGVDGLAIATAEFANNFVFRPNGRVMGATAAQNNGQFTFCDERGAEHAKAVLLELSGRPRVAYSGIKLFYTFTEPHDWQVQSTTTKETKSTKAGSSSILLLSRLSWLKQTIAGGIRGTQSMRPLPSWDAGRECKRSILAK